jgi:hypothetical protein
LTECRLQAETAIAQDKPTSWIAVAIWFLQNPTLSDSTILPNCLPEKDFIEPIWDLG